MESKHKLTASLWQRGCPAYPRVRVRVCVRVSAHLVAAPPPGFPLFPIIFTNPRTQDQLNILSATLAVVKDAK